MVLELTRHTTTFDSIGNPPLEVGNLEARMTGRWTGATLSNTDAGLMVMDFPIRLSHDTALRQHEEDSKASGAHSAGPIGSTIDGGNDPSYESLFPDTSVSIGNSWDISGAGLACLFFPACRAELVQQRACGYDWPKIESTSRPPPVHLLSDITPCFESLYPLIVEMAFDVGQLSGRGQARYVGEKETAEGQLGMLSIDFDIKCRAHLDRQVFGEFNATENASFIPFVGMSVSGCDVIIGLRGSATVDWDLANGRVRQVNSECEMELIDHKLLTLSPFGHRYEVVILSKFTGVMNSTATTVFNANK